MAVARGILVILSGILLAVSLYLDLTVPIPPTFFLTFFAFLIFVGSLFERHRYKRLHDDRPGSEWQETSERFVDPETGKLVTVYYHQKTGKRRYVAVTSQNTLSEDG